MFKTKITEMLGIQYPILQGGMAHLSRAELAAAVSNAGGLGIIISAHFPSGKDLRQEIKKTKELTDKPFGVNLSLFPSVKPIPNEEFVQVIIDEKLAAVETSGFRAPEEFVPPLRQAGVKVIHKCASARHAAKAESVGVDAVAVVGLENGGAVGMDNVGSLVLIPKAVSSVRIPLIAGGGIGDARGFVAALALGAEGVVMGTAFMATKECPTHPSFRALMLRSTELDTVVIERSIRNAHRSLKSKAVDKVLEMESRGASLEELLTVVGGENFKKVVMDGELDAGPAYCGQVVGLINNILTVQELFDSIVSEAREIQNRLSAILN
ncbi:NAD(P)H-dependent flavin oxidoreductase [Chloroflexota bacterium]